MPQSPRQVSDLLSDLTSQLHRQALEPNMLSYQPTPPQEKFHRNRLRKKIYQGGNRAGKTTAGTIEMIWWCAKRHPYRPEINDYPLPIRGRMIGKDLDTVKKILYSAIKRWVIKSDLKGGSWETAYVAQERMLYFENGSSIEFRSYDQDQLQHAGQSLHCIQFDEPPPEEIYKENLLRLMDTHSLFEGCGAFWMTYTPVKGIDWLYGTLYKPALADPDGSRILLVMASVDSNPYITEEAKDEVLSGLSEDEIKVRRHGEYVQLAGLVFKEWNPIIHVMDVSDIHDIWGDSLLPPKNWEIYWSLDHGLNAPSAIYWHAVSPTGQIVTFHEIYKRETLVRDFAEEIIEYERYLGRRPRLRTGDPAIKQRSGITGTSILQEYARHGIYIAVDSVPKDPSIGIVRMRQHLRVDPRTGLPRWRVFQCPNLSGELIELHWDTYVIGSEKKNPKETVHKHNDHGFDSCKYLFTFMPTLTPEEMGEKPVDKASELGAVGSLENTLAFFDAPATVKQNGFIIMHAPALHSAKTVWIESDYGLEEQD